MSRDTPKTLIGDIAVQRVKPGIYHGRLAEEYDGIGQYVLVSLSMASVSAAYKARVASGDFGTGQRFPVGTPVSLSVYRGKIEILSLGSKANSIALGLPARAATPASCDLPEILMTQIPTPNGDFEAGTGANWSGAAVVAGDPQGVGGSFQSFDVGGGSGGWRYTGWLGILFDGQKYVARYYVGTATGGNELRFGDVDGGDYTSQGPVSDSINCVEYTPVAPTTAVVFEHVRAGGGTLQGDNLQGYSGGSSSNPLNGILDCVARCDHRHDELLPRDPTVNDDADHGYPITTFWTNSLTDEMFVSHGDATGAADWHPVGGGVGSSLDLGWFNVEDYGAVHDGVTDDTSSIQDTIDAAAAAGGGTVYFPAGVYIVAGALQDTGGHNSQLKLPSIDYVDSKQMTIVLRGAQPPPPIMSVIGTTPVPDAHSIIKGTLNAGTGQLLAGYNASGHQLFTNVYLGMRDLTVRMPPNPVLTALNLRLTAAVDIDNVVVDVGSYYVQSLTEPTTATSFGVRLPALDNGANTRVGILNVIGFYKGVEFGEHLNGEQINVWGCKQGIVPIASYHASHIKRLMTVHCERGIVPTGRAYLHVDQFNIEHAASGWWVTDYDIDDASNHLYGSAEWKVTLAGVGHDSTFTVNGATNFEYWEMGQTPGGAGHAEGHDHDGSPTQKLAQANTHESPDTDSSPTAIHHTLGTGANQAAAGDHGPHDGGTGIGPILITDEPAGSPLIFADLLQNSEGDDLLYASEP